MTPKAARGFLMLLLDNDQTERLRLKERLMEPRWLTPYEISELFHTKAGPKSESEIQEMEALEEKWGKLLWKRRQLEDRREAIPLRPIEELHDFDEYVMKHWNHTPEPKMQDY